MRTASKKAIYEKMMNVFQQFKTAFVARIQNIRRLIALLL